MVRKRPEKCISKTKVICKLSLYYKYTMIFYFTIPQICLYIHFRIYIYCIYEHTHCLRGSVTSLYFGRADLSALCRCRA